MNPGILGRKQSSFKIRGLVKARGHLQIRVKPIWLEIVTKEDGLVCQNMINQNSKGYRKLLARMTVTFLRSVGLRQALNPWRKCLLKKRTQYPDRYPMTMT